jgi:hypothetical protein
MVNKEAGQCAKCKMADLKIVPKCELILNIVPN